MASRSHSRRGRRSPLYSQPARIRPEATAARRSTGSRRPKPPARSCSTPRPRGAATGSSRTAAGSSTSPPSAMTWRRRASAPTRRSSGSASRMSASGATSRSPRSKGAPSVAEQPLVGIVVGSESDRERMQDTLDELTAQGIPHELEVRSAHRNPDAVAEYARSARDRGLQVLIAGAGLAAALPGVVAAHTDLPVIGVPLRSSKSVLDGLDALLSIVQMPPGVPVATVGVDNARNAAVLAARILALGPAL